MCRLRNIAMHDYQESVTTGQTDGQTDAGQSYPYVPLCFAGDTKILCFGSKVMAKVNFSFLSRSKVKVTGSKLLVPKERSCHKKYINVIRKPYIFWFKK